MSNYYFDFSVLEEASKEFTDMQKALESEIKEVGKQIGEELKTNTEICMPREKGEPRHGIHADEEVTLKVSKGKNKVNVSVQGGTVMGKLWWLIDDGHVAQNGRFIGGAHFTDRAYEKTNSQSYIDELLQRIIR